MCQVYTSVSSYLSKLVTVLLLRVSITR